MSLKATAAVAGHDKEINAVAVSPNDALVATGSLDKTAKLWKLPDLVLGVTLRGHKRGVWGLAFSPVDKVRIVWGEGWVIGIYHMWWLCTDTSFPNLTPSPHSLPP